MHLLSASPLVKVILLRIPNNDQSAKMGSLALTTLVLLASVAFGSSEDKYALPEDFIQIFREKPYEEPETFQM